MFVAAVGEDELLSCPTCSYAANTERAIAHVLPRSPSDGGVSDESMSVLTTAFGVGSGRVCPGSTVVHMAADDKSGEKCRVAVVLPAGADANPFRVKVRPAHM